MQIPLVSICCLAYNHEPYIRECLEGFIMQRTTFDFEILIHDDASTDNTANIIREYEAKYPGIIKPIYQTDNQYLKGVFVTRTYNFPRAKGKYIAMCEGDDYWTDPYKLQKQVDFLETNPDYVITYHDFYCIDNESNERRKSPLTINDKADCTKEDLILYKKWIKTLTICFRNVVKDFPEEMNFVKNADTFLLSLLGNHGKGKWMGDEIDPGVYREHGGGVWSSLNIDLRLIELVKTYYWICLYYKRIGNLEVARMCFEKLAQQLYRVEKTLFDEVEDIHYLFEKQKMELKLIKNSKPYKIGRFLTVPFRFLKSKATYFTKLSLI